MPSTSVTVTIIQVYGPFFLGTQMHCDPLTQNVLGIMLSASIITPPNELPSVCRLTVVQVLQASL